MPILTEEALKMQLPRMVKVRQKFEMQKIPDIERAIISEMKRDEIKNVVKPGHRVAIAVGSRGISNISLIVKTVGEQLKQLGARPFVVPAMGSHGGATAEGQRDILAAYGVDDKTMDMPVMSSMDVLNIGRTTDGIPVYIDKNAFKADLIVPIARIKPHTDFRADIESGLCKMLAIGLGKHVGCSRLHQEGFSSFNKVIPMVADVILQNAPVGFGIAIVEDGYDETALIKAVATKDFLTADSQLLRMAKAFMPGIMLPAVDVLVVELIGKDISGGGMDPNVIGRTAQGRLEGFEGPEIQRIVVLGLTEAAHGNAIGLGLADFTTKEVFDKIDTCATYANAIASANPQAARVPIVMDNAREAIIAAVRCCWHIDENNPRIVTIKDTLHLEEIFVSENMLPEIQGNEKLEIVT